MPPALPALGSCVRRCPQGTERSQASTLLARAWRAIQDASPRTAVRPRLLFTSIWIGALLLPAWASGLCAHPLPDGDTSTSNGCTRPLPIRPAFRLLFIWRPRANVCSLNVRPVTLANGRPQSQPPALSALMGPGAGPREDSDTWGGRTEARASSGFRPRLSFWGPGLTL